MRVIILALIVYLVVILQVAVVPAFSSGNGGFNFPLVFVIGIALFRTKSEFIIWAAILGMLIDALTVYSLGIAIFILPVIAIVGNYLLKKFWGKPGVLPFLVLTALFSILYQLMVFSARLSLLLGEESFLVLFTSNFGYYLLDTLKAILANCALLVPLFYFAFLRLNQLFDYWEQKKKL